MLKLLALALCDVATGLLAVAGVMKMIDPTGLGGVMSALGADRRRDWTPLSRVLGAAEVTVAAVVAVVGSGAAFVTLAGSYAVFAAVAVRMARRPGESCGCFGVRSTPVSGTHVAVDLIAVAAAVGAAATGARPLLDRVGPGVAVTVVYLVFVALGTLTAVAAMTGAAELTALRRSRPSAARP